MRHDYNIFGFAVAGKKRLYWAVDWSWWRKAPADGRYYDGLLYRMSLMPLGGEFRIEEPT